MLLVRPHARKRPLDASLQPHPPRAILRNAHPLLLPRSFRVADNNGYGLKVYAFLKLAGVSFIHDHIFDTYAAPRGQLPYVVDDGETIGDSEAIIAHLKYKKCLTIDAALTSKQLDTDLLVRRMLDDLYWVMSYSRWKDDRSVTHSSVSTRT